MLFALPVIYGAVLLQGATAAVIHPDADLVARDYPHDNCLRSPYFSVHGHGPQC
jgi:hypothetical protein